MKLSVIIPTIDEERRLGNAIESAWRCGAFEVIVADGGSADSSDELARLYGCHVVRSPAGRGVQLNAGAKAAAGDVLLFLHADNRLHENIHRQLQVALEDPSVAGGAFRQRIEADGAVYRVIEKGNSLRARCLSLPYGDQGIFIRRGIFQMINGFPPVPLFEDVMLMQRLSKVAQPKLLDGPIFVSARRWQEHGVLTQTLRNWCLMVAFRLGVSPERLARHYRSQPRGKHRPTTLSEANH